MKTTFTRNVAESLAPASATDRTITAILSDESVALDNHVIITDGIDTTDFMKNPVVIFAHDNNSPPIARMLSIWKRGKQLVGKMQFADENTYPFADTVYKLIRGEYLNAMSISWFPTKYERANDRNRPDGLNFLACKILEASVVPVPSLSTALITARSSGIDFSSARDWARAASHSRNEVTRRSAETLIRTLSHRRPSATCNRSFEDLRREAIQLAAKINARILIHEWKPDEIEAAASASCAELVERAGAGGLSNNEICQLEGIFNAKIIRRAKSA